MKDTTITVDLISTCAICGRPIGRSTFTHNWNHIRHVGRAFHFVPVSPKHLGKPVEVMA